MFLAVYIVHLINQSSAAGGPKEDFGIKFNYNSGEPAPERITNEIYKFTQTISELKFGDIPDTDLASVGSNTYGNFEVGAASTAAHLHMGPCECFRLAPGSGHVSICRWRWWTRWRIAWRC